MSGRKTHNILPELDEVKPLKFAEIEVSYERRSSRDRRNSKGSDSDTESECSRGRRRKHRKCSHKRRTSSCSETFICHRVDEPCEISRSKSTTELSSRRHRSSRSHRHSTSSGSESDDSQDSASDDECCYHIKRKHRCYKKVRSKSKDRDGSIKRETGKKGSESSECKENDKDQMRVKKDKKKVEITSSSKKNENKSGVGSRAGKPPLSSTKSSSLTNKKRPTSAKLQKKGGSHDERMNRSIDKPKTPEESKQEQQQQEEQQHCSNDVSTKTTTNDEVSEDDKGLKEITTKAEVHIAETIQTTDVDEGMLTDATYTIEKRDKNEMADSQVIKEEIVTTSVTATESNKKVSFKGEDEIPPEEEIKIAEVKIVTPVEQEPSSDETSKPLSDVNENEKAFSPLPPEMSEDDSPENIQRPKSQTPESIGSFTVLDDGDDAEQKLKEFEEMTQPADEDESEEQQYFDDSSSMEKLPRRSKMRDSEGYKIIDDGKDQDSGIEPSPRSHPRSKIPGPRNGHSSAVPVSRRSFIVADDRPRSTRIEGRKPGDKNACNMTTVTQSIQKNIRR